MNFSKQMKRRLFSQMLSHGSAGGPFGILPGHAHKLFERPTAATRRGPSRDSTADDLPTTAELRRRLDKLKESRRRKPLLVIIED